jgi:hypothetical protein
MMTSMEPGEALGLAAQVAVTLAGVCGCGGSFSPALGAPMVQRRQVSSPAVAQQFNLASGLRCHRDFSARDEAAAGSDLAMVQRGGHALSAPVCDL